MIHTKGELLQALSAFGDDQPIIVFLFADQYPKGAQIIIQDVTLVPPWRPGGNGNAGIIGLVAHDQNGTVDTAKIRRAVETGGRL